MTFTVTGSPPPPPPPPPDDGGVQGQTSQSPEPVLGETVVAGKVHSGTIRAQGPQMASSETLGANEAIPLGSDGRRHKGRVRLTSATGAGGVVQTADFFGGSFVITQTSGSKPITHSSSLAS